MRPKKPPAISCNASPTYTMATIASHEARGQPKEAADCYRKVIEIIRGQPNAYDQELADVFVKLLAKLDPAADNSS